MKAVYVRTRGAVEIVDAPEPNPGPTDILVEPLLAAICGSDLRRLYHLPEEEYPLPIGAPAHEIIARVVSGKRAGEIVLALLPPAENAMAERCTVPPEHLIELPPGVPWPELLMAQQLGTVIYALRRLPAVRGLTCLVIGQGSAGLFFNNMLKRGGAKTVIAVDLSPARAAVARAFGADYALCADGSTILPQVAELTDGKLVDLVVEACGETATIQAAPSFVRTNGWLLHFGIPHEATVQLDFLEFFRRYLYTTSTGSSSLAPDKSHTREALALVADGSVDVKPMITHTLPFARVAEGYRMAFERTDGAVKVLIEMPGLVRHAP